MRKCNREMVYGVVWEMCTIDGSVTWARVQSGDRGIAPDRVGEDRLRRLMQKKFWAVRYSM